MCEVIFKEGSITLNKNCLSKIKYFEDKLDSDKIDLRAENLSLYGFIKVIDKIYDFNCNNEATFFLDPKSEYFEQCLAYEDKFEQAIENNNYIAIKYYIEEKWLSENDFTNLFNNYDELDKHPELLEKIIINDNFEIENIIKNTYFDILHILILDYDKYILNNHNFIKLVKYCFEYNKDENLYCLLGLHPYISEDLSKIINNIAQEYSSSVYFERLFNDEKQLTPDLFMANACYFGNINAVKKYLKIINLTDDLKEECVDAINEAKNDNKYNITAFEFDYDGIIQLLEKK